MALNRSLADAATAAGQAAGGAGNAATGGAALPYLSVRAVQQALYEARDSGMSIPSPGPIDGVWGPITERSIDEYLSRLTPPYHGAVNISEEKDRLFIPNNAIMRALNDLAQRYASRNRGGGITASSDDAQIIDVSSGPSPMMWIVAGVFSVAAIGGAVWWFTKKRGR